jgi:hypothetical protein
MSHGGAAAIEGPGMDSSRRPSARRASRHYPSRLGSPSPCRSRLGLSRKALAQFHGLRGWPLLQRQMSTMSCAMSKTTAVTGAPMRATAAARADSGDESEMPDAHPPESDAIASGA